MSAHRDSISKTTKLELEKLLADQTKEKKAKERVTAASATSASATTSTTAASSTSAAQVLATTVTSIPPTNKTISLFTAAHEDWFKYYRARGSLDPKQDALKLQQEMEEEVAILNKATIEANTLLDVVALCDERIAFNEYLLAFLRSADITSINSRIKSLFEHERGFKTKEEALSLFPDLIENDIKQYNNIKLICRTNTNDPLLLEYVYEEVSLWLRKEQERSFKKMKTNPNYEVFHLSKITEKLKPFISPLYLDYYHTFLSQKKVDSGVIKPYALLAIDAKFLLKKINELKIYLKNNQDILSTHYKKEILKTLEDTESMADACIKTSNSNPNFPLRFVNPHDPTNFMAVTLKQNEAESMFNFQKKFKKLFYSIREKSLELKLIEEKISDACKSAKALQKQQKEAVKLAALSNLATSELLIPHSSIEAAVSICSETKAKLEREKLEQEAAILEMNKKEMMAWQTQKELELREYKQSVEAQRALKARITEHRTDILDADLNPFKAKTRAALRNPADPKENAETQTLADFEAKQLVFLLQAVPNLVSFLNKLRQRQLDYQELKNIIKKLSENIIVPGKHQGFQLIQEGAHFTMYLPNTHKPWPSSKTGYELEPRQMSTLNSWKGQHGNHQVSQLSDWAVERCEQAFIRAGISLERLELATNNKRSRLGVKI